MAVASLKSNQNTPPALKAPILAYSMIMVPMELATVHPSLATGRIIPLQDKRCAKLDS